MDIRKTIKSLLLIFVVLSFAFLIYKEFSPKSESDAIDLAITKGKTTTAYDNSARAKESKAIKVPETLPRDQGSLSQTTVESQNSKVIAYYFHGTFRCTACRTIERYSQEAIEQYFTNELQNGTLEFRHVNVEEPENRHFIHDYQLFSRSLVISLVKQDKEITWKNLVDVWKHLRDKEKFFRYVKDEVEQFLKETG